MPGLDDFAKAIVRWREQPPFFVREVLKCTPDPWQDDVLAAFPGNPRIAMKASKGPGKTALIAWLGWNFLLTRPHPKIAATSITADNLSDNLWTEMAKWQGQSEILKSMFTWSKTRIVCNEHPETWWMSARTWSRSASPDEQANTLAGLHADYIFFILDESGGMPDSIMVAAEAALSTCKEGHIVQAGNPTNLEGPLYRACTTDRKNWWVTEISGDPDDPKRSPRVSIDWAKKQIDTYGKDNPWVLVNVFGRFPPGSLNALIGPDEVNGAMRRTWREHDIGHAARVLGVDVARFGDDSSIIFPRHGIQAYTPWQYRNLDSTQGAAQVSIKWEEFDADAAFIDDTGGFGSGWIDQTRLLGKQPIPVHFASAPHNRRYANKRAEMAFDAIEWIKAGGALPNCPELLAALTQTTYSFKGDSLILEPKDDVKAKIGYSPDHFDAFILTFAERVEPKRQRFVTGYTNALSRGLARAVNESYDPFAEVR